MVTDRVSVSYGPAGPEVRIRAQRNWFVILFLPVWLAGWTVGGVAAIVSVLREPQVFLAAWLVGWVLGEGFAITALAWQLFGAEVVSVEDGLLTIAREVGPWRMARRYPVAACQNLRAAGWFGSEHSFEASMRPWGLTGGTVAVDCASKTDRFGIGLNERDAAAVVQQVEALLTGRWQPGTGATCRTE